MCDDGFVSEQDYIHARFVNQSQTRAPVCKQPANAKFKHFTGVPLGAKRETLQDYKHLFKGIQWHEHHNHIATSDGKRLSSVTATTGGSQAGKKHILVLYLQGYLLHAIHSLSLKYFSQPANTLPATAMPLPPLRGSHTSPRSCQH